MFRDLFGTNDMTFLLDQIFRNLIFLNIIFSIVIVFFQRKEPKSVWAWLLLLYAIPILGILIYIMAGTDMHKRKMFHTKEVEDRINEAIRKQEDSILRHELDAKNPTLLEYSDLVLYNLQTAGAVLSNNNSVKIFTDGHDKFENLKEDIRNAKEHIHIQYYIIRKDELFESICELLIEKVKEGVEVRILYDGMGCRKVAKSYWRYLKKHGIQLAEFFPPLLGALHLRLNYRNHRKIVVIDGTIGWVGGFNIAREYLGLKKRFGYWRDTHLRLMGSSVLSLQMRFILDWNYAANENLFSKGIYLNPEVAKHKGNKEIQIISSGPDSRIQNIRDNYLRLIHKAKTSIYIQTPYFIPDEPILSALMIAVTSGIQVYLMIPCKPDHPFIYWATYSYFGDLISAGAKCYVYRNGFLHAKGMIVDDSVLCYGTANMDIRSFALNFEVNAIIYDEETAKEMVEIFWEDVTKSKLITKDLYLRRSFMVRVKEQVCRLLSPLL